MQSPTPDEIKEFFKKNNVKTAQAGRILYENIMQKPARRDVNTPPSRFYYMAMKKYIAGKYKMPILKWNLLKKEIEKGTT
jgi:hypothetical protein